MTTITTTKTASGAQHSIVQMASRQIPHGLGLLTTVASLPPKYRSRYLNLKVKSETPLDLSVKPNSPVPHADNADEIVSDVPMATAFTEVYTEPANVEEVPVATQVFSDSSEVTLVPINHDVYVVQETAPTTHVEDEAIVTITQISKPITPPPTPTKRKHAVMLDEAAAVQEEVLTIIEPLKVSKTMQARENPTKLAKTVTHPTTKRDCTPTKPIKSADTAPKTIKSQPPATKLTKNKATRKLKFDEETSSPVSGTIIRPLEDITDGNVHYSNGDIDPKYNIVEITEETKAELAAIKNVIGDYICKLCRIKFDDAFGLARHRCACIVLLEYRCPECGKQFNCPANLASHRRWHKPKKTDANGSGGGGAGARKENRNTTNSQTASAKPKQTDTTTDLPYPCEICGKRFKRLAYLRKHQQIHNKKRNTSTSTTTSTGSIAGAQDTQVLISDGRLSTASTLVIGGSGNSYQSYAGSTSSVSSSHSYNGISNEDEHGSYATAHGAYIEYVDEEEDDGRSTASSAISMGYGRLQIVETGLTEEENIAAAALTNLRNCASVIQHTTLAH
ncbi:uncharacterized protein nerfin-1 [Eurosta solidaginis]|uniref:uncharacterized protein nerfin-1 n=1 Tax=Eurosta solidaginis TaxID=178769 RepID=UPI0035306B20